MRTGGSAETTEAGAEPSSVGGPGGVPRGADEATGGGAASGGVPDGVLEGEVRRAAAAGRTSGAGTGGERRPVNGGAARSAAGGVARGERRAGRATRGGAGGEEGAKDGGATLGGGEEERAAGRDAYEEWMAIARRHPPSVGDDVIAGWLADLSGGDAEAAERAIDQLVRHSVLWMTECLRLNRFVPRGALQQASALRDDLLAEARTGFLLALRRWKPGENATARETRSRFLTHTRWWIDNRVNQFLAPERLRMKAREGVRRQRVLATQEALARRMGRAPTTEEIVAELETRARASVARAQEGEPTAEQLRNAGALSERRVTKLLEHATETVSLDEVLAGDKDGGRGGGTTRGDVLAAETGGAGGDERAGASGFAGERALSDGERRRALDHYVALNDARATAHVDRERIARLRYGLGAMERPMSAQEIAYVVGGSAESVNAVLAEVQVAMRGAERAAALDVAPEGRAAWLRKVERALAWAPRRGARGGAGDAGGAQLDLLAQPARVQAGEVGGRRPGPERGGRGEEAGPRVVRGAEGVDVVRDPARRRFLEQMR